MAERLSFYDLKAKKKFNSQTYTIKTRIVKNKMKKFAVAKSPLTGNEAWRILPQDYK